MYIFKHKMRHSLLLSKFMLWFVAFINLFNPFPVVAVKKKKKIVQGGVRVGMVKLAKCF